MKERIKWPAGNRLDLCIPLRKITVTEEGTQFGEYIPSQAAVVMVYLVGNYASYEYTPRIEDNKLFITDNGELKPGVYAIDVRIQEPERQLRSFRLGELEIVRETKQLALGDFVLDNNITLDADAFIFGEGPSAYDVAVRDGYTGTKAEWLESLRGKEGRGIADIVALPTGAFRILLTDGSAYTTPILKGEQGVSISDISVTGITTMEVLCTVTMSDGTTHQLNLPRGEQGAKGDKGDDGQDGRGIQSIVLNADYTLTFNYSDGTTFTTPQSLRGEKGENGKDGQDGQDGRGISSMALDDDNHLTVSYSDGTTYTTPQSLQGERGVSITDFEQVGESATMTFFNIYYSSGNISQIGLPKGEQGDRGEQGPQGPKGDTVVLGEVGEYKLYNVAGSATDGAMTQDATTKAIAANNGYYECSTAAGTAAKVAVGDNEALYILQKGGSIKVKMTNANAAASGVTLKIGSSAATPLYYNGEPVSAQNTWDAGEVLSVYYDGTYYQASNAQGGGGKAEKIKYSNFESDLISTDVQDAVDEIADKVIMVDTILEPSMTSVTSTNAEKLTIAIDEGNYVINNITKTSGVLGKITFPASIKGKTVTVKYTYTSNIANGTGNFFGFSSDSTALTNLGPISGTSGTIVKRNILVPTNATHIRVYSNNMASGTVLTISDFSFTISRDLKDDVVLNTANISEIKPKVDNLTADAINTDGLECSVHKSSGSGTTITIENTSENNYKIHCITKTGYTYVLLKLPTGIVAGKQYKITYTYSSTSSSSANFVFANSSYTNVGGFSSFVANAKNQQVSIVYTHQSSYVYLMTFNNDITTGADIIINDFTITIPHSIVEIEGRISALEPKVIPSAYYNGMHVELGNDYGYIFSTTSTSIRCNEGMAMYGDYIVCVMLAAGETYLNIYKKTEGVYSLVASITGLGLGHANSMQFASTRASGQAFPLLYVSGCSDRKCYVVQITLTSETVEEVTTETYSASVVQTISFPTTTHFATTENVNSQIGDDGYLYLYHLNFGCTRLRCPKVSEGNITMTEDDVYDYYEFHYPYATYVWQGGVIHKGMLFMPVGNNNKTKCLFVFDIYNHSLKALINLDAFMAASEEPEDAEVYNGELYIAMYAGASATSSKAMKKIKFL